MLVQFRGIVLKDQLAIRAERNDEVGAGDANFAFTFATNKEEPILPGLPMRFCRVRPTLTSLD